MADDNSSLGIIFLIFLIIIILLIGVATLTQQQEQDSNIQIKTTPPPTATPDYVYTNLTVAPSEIYWGTLLPNTTYTRLITLTNTGNASSNPLSIEANPSVGTVTWDAEGKTIPSNSTLIVTFSLWVKPDAPQGHFNFPITVWG